MEMLDPHDVIRRVFNVSNVAIVLGPIQPTGHGVRASKRVIS
jgi:hypothetical protein